jgi:hypothetical protein
MVTSLTGSDPLPGLLAVSEMGISTTEVVAWDRFDQRSLV